MNGGEGEIGGGAGGGIQDTRFPDYSGDPSIVPTPREFSCWCSRWTRGKASRQEGKVVFGCCCGDSENGCVCRPESHHARQLQLKSWV